MMLQVYHYKEYNIANTSRFAYCNKEAKFKVTNKPIDISSSDEDDEKSRFAYSNKEAKSKVTNKPIVIGSSDENDEKSRKYNKKN